jgi:hypothetical protein
LLLLLLLVLLRAPQLLHRSALSLGLLRQSIQTRLYAGLRCLQALDAAGMVPAQDGELLAHLLAQLGTGGLCGFCCDCGKMTRVRVCGRRNPTRPSSAAGDLRNPARQVVRPGGLRGAAL